MLHDRIKQLRRRSLTVKEVIWAFLLVYAVCCIGLLFYFSR